MGTRAVSGPEQGAYLQGRGGEMPAGMRLEGVPGCLTSASAAPTEPTSSPQLGSSPRASVYSCTKAEVLGKLAQAPQTSPASRLQEKRKTLTVPGQGMFFAPRGAPPSNSHKALCRPRFP